MCDSNRVRVVYISYDGALDPLGRSQVIPVVTGLADLGCQMRLVTYEKKERRADEVARVSLERELAHHGVRWSALSYHKRFSLFATAWDLLRGLVLVSTWCIRRKVDLVHARSYPSTLIAWVIYRIWKVPYIFDMRALYGDDRVDAGLWLESSLAYRLTKWLEKRFLRDASSVVTLTHASVPVICEIESSGLGGKVPEVIPTCADLEHFTITKRADPENLSITTGGKPQDLSIRAGADPEHFTPAEVHRASEAELEPELAYFGSIGPTYLVDEMLRFGKVFLDRFLDGRLVFIVNDGLAPSGQSALEEVRGLANSLGIEPARFEVTSLAHQEIVQRLRRVSATYVFVRPGPSKVAMASTKVSESFALGIPVAINRGIGDSADIIDSEGIGVVVDPFDSDTWPQKIDELLELSRLVEVREKCRAQAELEHSLAGAIKKYANIYNRNLRVGQIVV